jgi:hypothetical protein
MPPPPLWGTSPTLRAGEERRVSIAHEFFDGFPAGHVRFPKEPLRRRVADESGDRLAVTGHPRPTFFDTAASPSPDGVL